MDHQALKDLLPLAALGWLDPEEERSLGDHLPVCAECRAELDAFREAGASVAMAEDATGSEERIWNRLQARLSADDALRVTAAGSRPGGRPAVRRPPALRWQVATGFSIAAAIVIAIYAGLLSQAQSRYQDQLAALTVESRAIRADLDDSRRQTVALQHVLDDRARLQRALMAPDLELTRLEPLGPAPNASAIVAVSRSTRTAIIEASDLPPASAGKTYELWWITKESGPVAAGLFQAASGRQVIAQADPPPAGQRVVLCAVTLEPAGGVRKPSGAMYLKGAPGRNS